MSNASYNQFNYNYRPAKSIERKIIVELLRGIYGVANAQKCTYIGMGSIFFTDFRLVHKELGIDKMINIEQNEADKKRFKFNKPYSCIELNWGMATDILPQLEWEENNILWLDYDESLQPYMFDDINITFSNINNGSFFVMSCNSKLQKYFDRENSKYKVEQFKNDFDKYTPYELAPKRMTNKNSPSLILEMVNERINHILSDRNATRNKGEKLVYHQMLNITYRDGAPMFTTGGIILNKQEYDNFIKDEINNLPYIKKVGNESLSIENPIITNQEMDLLNSFLPRSKKKFLKLKTIDFIPELERAQYQKIYRYFPNFVEIRDY